MDDIIKFFTDTIRENTIAQGGIVIAAFSALLVYSKRIPILIFSFLKRRCTSYLQLDQQQEPLKWMLIWLAKTNYGKSTKHLTVGNNEGDLAIGNGKHFFFRNKRLVIVSYYRTQVEFQGMSIGMKETIDLRVIPGKRQIIEDIIRESKAVYEEANKGKIEVYMPQWGDHWKLSDVMPKRSVESVVLSQENEETLHDKLEQFKRNKPLCEKMGIPWRLGFLLHGEPGNGKTSLAAAIASLMNYKLHILNLNGLSSDKELLMLCACVEHDSVLLIEDIDTYDIDREGKKKISLSGLLNALDGVTAKNGRITIMTTNRREELDEALIRKGRADVHLELSAPDNDQFKRLFERFDQTYNGETFKNMAEAQNYLLS